MDEHKKYLRDDNYGTYCEFRALWADSTPTELAKVSAFMAHTGCKPSLARVLGMGATKGWSDVLDTIIYSVGDNKELLRAPKELGCSPMEAVVRMLRVLDVPLPLFSRMEHGCEGDF